MDAAQARLGWALPEEYRFLLAAVGPYKVSEEGNEEWTELLVPSRRSAEATALHAHLELLRPHDPEGDAFAAIVRAPIDELLVAATYRDANHHTQWIFYRKGSEALYEVHKKDPFEELAGRTPVTVGLAFPGRLGGWCAGSRPLTFLLLAT